MADSTYMISWYQTKTAFLSVTQGLLQWYKLWPDVKDRSTNIRLKMFTVYSCHTNKQIHFWVKKIIISTSFTVTHLRRPNPIFLLFFSVSSGSSAFFFSFSFPFPLFFSFFFVFAFFFLSFLPFSSIWSPTPWRDELLAGVSRPELGSEPSSGGNEGRKIKIKISGGRTA